MTARPGSRPCVLVVDDDDDVAAVVRGALQGAAGDRADLADLREANRQLPDATEEARDRADAQTSPAAALRQLLEARDLKERGAQAGLEVLRSITSNLRVAVFLVDARGQPMYLNPAAEAMFGLTLAEISGAPLHERVHHHHPDGRPFLAADCVINAALLERTALRDHEDAFIRKDGTFFPARCDVTPLEVAGRPLGVMWEVRDRSREAAVEEARREVAALIAHDLRTPLTGLRGQAELLARRLKRKQGSDDDHLHALESIIANTQRMERMIRELVESAYLESGTLVLRRTAVDLSRLAADVTSEVAAKERRRIRIVAPGGTLVSADPERLGRVLMNLLQNALKYSPPDAPVDVEVQQDGREAVVSIVDRGVGIPAGELPRIFQRFARAGKANAGADGFGLGLYIARLIVEAHGGQVRAESEVGRGSRIGFALPLDTSNGPAATVGSPMMPPLDVSPATERLSAKGPTDP